jgi:hypothetical protein
LFRGGFHGHLIQLGLHITKLVGCFARNFLESTATVAMTTSAMTAREPVGNSGVVEEVEDVLVVALTLDDEVEDVVEVDEVVVEVDDVVT